MVCLKASKTHCCHPVVLQLALVMIFLILCGLSSINGLRCHCSFTGNSCNKADGKCLHKGELACVIVAGDIDDINNVTIISKTCFRQSDIEAYKSKGGKIYSCNTDMCNSQQVNSVSDLDKLNNSASGLSYSNAIGLLIGLCGFSLWFVITNNISSVGESGRVHRGPLM